MAASLSTCQQTTCVTPVRSSRTPRSQNGYDSDNNDIPVLNHLFANLKTAYQIKLQYYAKSYKELYCRLFELRHENNLLQQQVSSFKRGPLNSRTPGMRPPTRIISSPMIACNGFLVNNALPAPSPKVCTPHAQLQNYGHFNQQPQIQNATTLRPVVTSNPFMASVRSRTPAIQPQGNFNGSKLSTEQEPLGPRDGKWPTRLRYTSDSFRPRSSYGPSTSTGVFPMTAACGNNGSGKITKMDIYLQHNYGAQPDHGTITGLGNSEAKQTAPVVLIGNAYKGAAMQRSPSMPNLNGHGQPHPPDHWSTPKAAYPPSLLPTANRTCCTARRRLSFIPASNGRGDIEDKSPPKLVRPVLASQNYRGTMLKARMSSMPTLGAQNGATPAFASQSLRDSALKAQDCLPSMLKLPKCLRPILRPPMHALKPQNSPITIVKPQDIPSLPLKSQNSSSVATVPQGIPKRAPSSSPKSSISPQARSRTNFPPLNFTLPSQLGRPLRGPPKMIQFSNESPKSYTVPPGVSCTAEDEDKNRNTGPLNAAGYSQLIRHPVTPRLHAKMPPIRPLSSARESHQLMNRPASANVGIHIGQPMSSKRIVPQGINEAPEKTKAASGDRVQPGKHIIDILIENMGK